MMLSSKMKPKSFFCSLSSTVSLTVPGTTRECRRLVAQVHRSRQLLGRERGLARTAGFRHGSRRSTMVGAVGLRRTLRRRGRLRGSGGSCASPGAMGRGSVVGRAGARLAGQVAVSHGALSAANGLTGAAHRVLRLGDMVSMLDSTAALHQVYSGRRCSRMMPSGSCHVRSRQPW